MTWGRWRAVFEARPGFASETPVFAIFTRNLGPSGREGFAQPTRISLVRNFPASSAGLGFASSAGRRDEKRPELAGVPLNYVCYKGYRMAMAAEQWISARKRRKARCKTSGLARDGPPG